MNKERRPSKRNSMKNNKKFPYKRRNHSPKRTRRDAFCLSSTGARGDALLDTSGDSGRYNRQRMRESRSLTSGTHSPKLVDYDGDTPEDKLSSKKDSIVQPSGTHNPQQSNRELITSNT